MKPYFQTPNVNSKKVLGPKKWLPKLSENRTFPIYLCKAFDKLSHELITVTLSTYEFILPVLKIYSLVFS